MNFERSFVLKRISILNFISGDIMCRFSTILLGSCLEMGVLGFKWCHRAPCRLQKEHPVEHISNETYPINISIKIQDIHSIESKLKVLRVSGKVVFDTPASINFNGRFVGPYLSHNKYPSDSCPCNICPGIICPGYNDHPS